MNEENFGIVIHQIDNLNLISNFFITHIIKGVKGNLYIINFSSDNIDTVILNINQKLCKNKKLDDRIIQVNGIGKSVKSIEECLETLKPIDEVLVLGAERLVKPYTDNKPFINAKYGEDSINFHLMGNMNWNSLGNEINQLFSKYKDRLQGMLIYIYLDYLCYDSVLKCFEEHIDNEFNIIQIKKEENEKGSGYKNVKLQYDIINKIKNTDFQEGMSIVEKYKKEIEENQYIYLKSVNYLVHGYLEECINILDSNYDILLDEQKLVYGQALMQEGEDNKYDKVQRIIDEILENNPYLNGVLELYIKKIRAAKEEISEEKIKALLKIDPNNVCVLEYYASFLSNNKRYKEAAKEFRGLSKLINRNYYEIIARINEILDDEKISIDQAERYVWEIVDKDERLHNEAVYRMSSIYFFNKQLIQPAYRILKKGKLEVNLPRVKDIVELKMDILSDFILASKALTQEEILNERIETLISGISILATDKNCTGIWEKYIDIAQTAEVWQGLLYEEVKKFIRIIVNKDYTSYLSNSVIRKCENIQDDMPQEIGLLYLIRHARINDKFEGIDDNNETIIDTVLKCGEIIKDEKIKVLLKYYASLFYAQKGEFQLANNFALSILDYYNRIGDGYKDLCIYLGLLAWGNSQFRVKRYIDGLACIIASYKYAECTQEFYPFFEDGLNIIALFLDRHKEMISEQDKKLIQELQKRFARYNKTIQDVCSFIVDPSENKIAQLEAKVQSSKGENEWCINMCNLISAYISQHNYMEAKKRILMYKDRIILLLECRKDTRYEVLYFWAQISYYNRRHYKDEERAINFLEQAIKDINWIRRVYHKDQRVGLRSESEKIYRLYIELLLCKYERNINNKEEVIRKLPNGLIGILPCTILEYNDYQINKSISEDNEKKHKELQQVYKLYNSRYISNKGDYEAVHDLAVQSNNLSEELVNNDPRYMGLPSYMPVSFEDIQRSLQDNDIFYQFLMTQQMVLTLLITKNDIILTPKRVDITIVNNQLVLYNNLIETESHNEKTIEYLENIQEKLSEIFCEELISYVCENDVENVYVMQDHKSNLFSVTNTNILGKYLIDYIDNLIHVIDYHKIGKFRENKCEHVILNRIFGSEQDKELVKIKSWMNGLENQDFIIVPNTGDSVDNVKLYTKERKTDILILYGHGIQDPYGSKFGGAQGIEGQEQIIRMQDLFSNGINVNSIILISCMGGTPMSSSPELSEGCWMQLFEYVTGNIVICKWSVPTVPTIKVLDSMIKYIRTNKMSIGKALLQAQKDARQRYKCCVHWAGIEMYYN